MRNYRWLLAVLAVTVPANVSGATEYEVDPAQSVFAVVVHKAGVAARFAHNHLVCAEEYTAKLSVDGSDAVTTRFELELPAAKLRVDAPEAHTKWYPGIEKAGILNEAFRALNEDDRKTVAEHMLAKDQLDAGQYPTISAKITKVRAGAGTHGKLGYTHIVAIEFTARGKTVERECPSSIVIENDRVTVDAMGAFEFSEFGIKPYSAMMGAVKNKDEFHAFVHVVANRKT